jgi:hypothetical protein
MADENTDVSDLPSTEPDDSELISEYKESAYHALGGFQLLEQLMKDFIISCNEVITSALGPEITYRPTVKEIDNAPLGKLMVFFKVHTSNENLINSLNTILPKRKDLAHNALAVIYWDKMTSQDYFSRVEEFYKLSRELERLQLEVLNETDLYHAAMHKKFNT